MKNKFLSKNVLIILLINTLLIAFLLIAANKVVPVFLAKARMSFLPKDQADFYRHYAHDLHHLRDFDFLTRLPPEYQSTKTDFIFSKIGTQNKIILFQGDSWTEQFLTSESSSVLLDLFARKNKLEFVVAGTTSYSPSAMAAQFRVLQRDFAINPTIVVATIDQTDFGDEVCRYRSQLSTNKNGDLIILQNDTTKNIPYDVKPYFELMDILDSDENSLIKLWQYGLKKIQKREVGGCSNDGILNPLRGLYKQEDGKYFTDRVANYITTVLNAQRGVDHLFLVTFFHKSHVDGTYTTNVNQFVDDAISLSGKQGQVTHLNFVPKDYDESELGSMFKPGDLFSHLTNKAHAKLFTDRILNSIQPLLVDQSAVKFK